MGDANPSGVALYKKWAEAEYTNAINFAIDLVKEDYLIPCTGVITWASDTYNYAPPTGGSPASDMCYLYEIRGRRSDSNVDLSADRTPEVYEVEYPLDWISVQRDTDGTLELHFDEASIQRRGFNIDTAEMRVQGYRFQAEMPVSDVGVLDIPWSVVALLAKQYLHLSAAGRDANDMMKNLRQWQAAAQEYQANKSEDIEAPGGIWLSTL